jgi:hypothetical protein
MVAWHPRPVAQAELDLAWLVLSVALGVAAIAPFWLKSNPPDALDAKAKELREEAARQAEVEAERMARIEAELAALKRWVAQEFEALRARRPRS